MNKTILVTSHARPIHEATITSIRPLCARGAMFLTQRNATDVALARNLALSGVCAALDEDPTRDVVLMVDDDMVFFEEAAAALVEHARSTGVAASGMYATTMGTLAATRLQTPAGERQLWVTGLGLLAIPAALLLRLRGESEPFMFLEKKNYGFTWSAAGGGNYWSEDYTLCRRLGGVHLLPIPIGHMKMIDLWPDEETVAHIREGRMLPGDLASAALKATKDPTMLAAMRFAAHQPDAEANNGAA